MTTSHAPLSPLHPHPRLWVRWFVQYNPAFTASALCVLGGVLVLSRAFGGDGDLALTCILELYQWLLIGTAALLSRRWHDHRPAAILGVIALVFLADPTLQLSALATNGAGLVCAAWVACFALKLHALAWAFRLKLSVTARAAPLVAAVIVAALPNARVLGVALGWQPSLLAAAVFALVALVVLRPPTVVSRRALGEVGTVMFPRLLRAAAAIGALGFSFQLWNATLAIGPQAFSPVVGAVLLALALRARTDARAWALALLGAALLLHTPWVGTAAVAALMAVRRTWVAVPALSILHASWVAPLARTLAPQTPLQWGGLLLGLGFVLVPAGVVLHRRFNRLLALDELVREEASTDGPATSVAIAAAVVPVAAAAEA